MILMKSTIFAAQIFFIKFSKTAYMKTVSMIASFVVTLALVFYSIGFSKESRKKLVTGQCACILYYWRLP